LDEYIEVVRSIQTYYQFLGFLEVISVSSVAIEMYKLIWAKKPSCEQSLFAIWKWANELMCAGGLQTTHFAIKWKSE